MKPSNNIGYLIQHLASTLAHQTDQLLQERLAIGFSQFKILMVLQQDPSLQQKQIANRLCQTEASISRQIKLLEEEGLLNIRVNPKNRREHIASPSSRGVKLTEKAREVLNAHYEPMFSQLSEHQQAELLNTLSIMHNYVCESGDSCQLNR